MHNEHKFNMKHWSWGEAPQNIWAGPDWKFSALNLVLSKNYWHLSNILKSPAPKCTSWMFLCVQNLFESHLKRCRSCKGLGLADIEKLLNAEAIVAMWCDGTQVNHFGVSQAGPTLLIFVLMLAIIIMMVVMINVMVMFWIRLTG